MKTGDIVRLQAFRHYFGNSMHVEYKVNKPKARDRLVGVFIYLGIEPLDPGVDGLDVERVLNQLGWFKNQCVDPKAPVVPCIVCKTPVHTCENELGPCQVHPLGAQLKSGNWVCSEACFETAT